MILFIHGFASCGLGRKSRLLIERFGADRVLAPDLPFSPAGAIAHLERLLEENPVDLLVGSSLGGYYATRLKQRHDIPAVLINPAVRPWELLDGHLGRHSRWCDGEPFEFTREHVAELQALYRPQLLADERYLVLLQSGDEVLDYRAAADYYRDFEVVIEQDGSHRFDNLAAYLPTISALRAATEQPS
jgi:predicted esterase YcpF (UPF0227 family)